MKLTIFSLALVLVLVGDAAFAQFAGTLVYQVNSASNRLVMTYYQAGTLAHMDAYNIKLNNGVTDTGSLKPQDTLQWGFSKGYETHLVFTSGLAVIYYYVTRAAMYQKLGVQMGGSMTVQAVGMETVNGYTCTHYTIASKSKISNTARDVWITTDLGSAPSVWVVGSTCIYRRAIRSWRGCRQQAQTGSW